MRINGQDVLRYFVAAMLVITLAIGGDDLPGQDNPAPKVEALRKQLASDDFDIRAEAAKAAIRNNFNVRFSVAI